MSRRVVPLTVQAVKGAKPREKMYKLFDGGGLALWVYPSGNRAWRLSFRENGKDQTLTLGRFPQMSLHDARMRRDELLREADLSRVRRSPANMEFSALFEAWCERWRASVSQKYGTQVLRAVRANCYPTLRGMDVRRIKTFDIVRSLRGMEERGVLEYLRRTKTGLSLFFDDLTGQGLIDVNPASGVGKRVFRLPEKRHFAALSPDELPRLIRALKTMPSLIVRLAILWQLCTMTRPSETAGARWSEINLEKRLWTIPAERMKRRRDHVLPLSDFLLDLLNTMRSLNRSGVFVFEGRSPDAPLNAGSLRVALARAGLNTTAHGLRATAATFLEEAGFEARVIDAALAHAKDGGNQTAAAYMRSSLFAERRRMMDFWTGKIAELFEME